MDRRHVDSSKPITVGELPVLHVGEAVSDEERDRTSQSARDETGLRTAGQRSINLIWERTQMKVALSVIWSALLVAAVLSILGSYLGTPDVQLAAVVFLFGVANLVTGFYFGRTNHQRSGGIGGETAGTR